jgi:hypothetical protein
MGMNSHARSLTLPFDKDRDNEKTPGSENDEKGAKRTLIGG